MTNIQPMTSTVPRAPFQRSTGSQHFPVLCTEHQAADEFGVDIVKLRRWVKRGELEPAGLYFQPGMSVSLTLYRCADILKLVGKR